MKPILSSYKMLYSTTKAIVAASALLSATHTGFAAGTGPNGVDVLHVPIAWCAVVGSPAQANPNLNGDTTTDAILWRRHERPTDNIFINTAGITFRSSINNSWNVLDFPQIADPDTTLGLTGDMRGEDVNNFGTEFNNLITNCDTAYTNIGRANIGVTAINTGLFHDGNGDYVTTVGWGGCTRPAGQVNSTCSTPYDGRITVIDNVFLHPSSPDRRWPGSNTVFSIKDPLDTLTGHELGHALGLGHANNATNLMASSMRDNDSDGDADNIALTAAQINTLRASSNNVPGLEIDPPLQIDPGDFVADRVMDLKEDKEIPSIADIASVKTTLDKKNNRLYISTQLGGAHENEFRKVPGTLWLAIDSTKDNIKIDPALAEKIELGHKLLDGIDTLIRVDFTYPDTRVVGWRVEGSEFAQFDNIFSELQTLQVHPWFVPAEGVENSGSDHAFLYDTISVSLPAKLVEVRLDQPFSIDAILETRELEVVDRLIAEPKDRVVVLEDPDFPHCFALEKGELGGQVPVLVEGLLPRAPVHALVGPVAVAKNETDDRGNLKFDLPIPDNIKEGLHLVTVGVDDTALTADCVVQVGKLAEPKPLQDIKLPEDPRIKLLDRHFDLLEKSLELMRGM